MKVTFLDIDSVLNTGWSSQGARLAVRFDPLALK